MQTHPVFPILPADHCPDATQYLDVMPDALTPITALHDQRQRPLHDLRISVTDRCNFRCTYCMPRDKFNDQHLFLPRRALLSFEEIVRLARLFAAHGVRKIRLTGGEPLLRRNLDHLIAALAQIPGLALTLTTNAVLLPKMATRLRDAGLQRITVSLDAMDDPLFRSINDADISVEQVLKGIEAATAAGFEQIKINMVVKRNTNDQDILPMARYFRGSGHIVRFIEFMDVGTSNGWQMAEVVPSREIVARIHHHFPLAAAEPNYHGEVAQRWRYCDGQGEIGVISSVTQAFCHSCTRLRLSTEGRLYTCLFATQGHDLRDLLRQGADDTTIVQRIRKVWTQREDRYSELRTANITPREKIEMSYIGG